MNEKILSVEKLIKKRIKKIQKKKRNLNTYSNILLINYNNYA